MSIGYAGPGWEWPSKADVFYQTAGVAKQFEVRRIHGKFDISAKVELQKILRSETIVLPPYGGIIKAAPYGCGYFTLSTPPPQIIGNRNQPFF
jgi:hypothetical protein